jgi:integral membrane protein
VRNNLRFYRIMAAIVGVLLVVLFFVGVPLGGFDGTALWCLEDDKCAFDSTPMWFLPGSDAQVFGDHLTEYLGVAHGWLYMIFLFSAFMLSRRAGWDLPFTVVTLICGTIPVLSFWAEHRAVKRVRAEFPETAPGHAATT